VDDSALALRFLASRLQPWGLAVECVSSSGKAVERLAQRDYDFVFIDVELGAESELDGLALCQHIKRHHPLAGSLLVMVSAHHSELDRVRGTLAGCDAYLGKPLQAAELERLLLRQGLKPPPVPPAPPTEPAGGEAVAPAGSNRD
jgi:DNA-binding response OmpR family regulator